MKPTAAHLKASKRAQMVKTHRVMHEFKEGELKSSSGKPVNKRVQAIAIALSEARKAKKG